MQCPTDGNQTLDDEENTASVEPELTEDAQAADAWAPDPSVEMDFKATMAATDRADIQVNQTATEPGRLSATWIALGVLVVFCVGLVVYLATSG
tara:strand:+ start:359 stop:640 length:282 start_codon:yes stop_codon:yes gene_type:complete